jgi:hypothetical protein
MAWHSYACIPQGVHGAALLRYCPSLRMRRSVRCEVLGCSRTRVLRMVRTPKLIAFDLDATLWYPEMDCTWGPPYTVSKGIVRDSRRTEIELMGASRQILNELATDPAWRETAVVMCA